MTVGNHTRNYTTLTDAIASRLAPGVTTLSLEVQQRNVVTMASVARPRLSSETNNSPCIPSKFRCVCDQHCRAKGAWLIRSSLTAINGIKFETRSFDLAEVRWKVRGTEIHRLSHSLVHEIDDEFARLANIPRRILRRAVRVRLKAQNVQWRCFGKDVEKVKDAPLRPSVVTRAIGRGSRSRIGACRALAPTDRSS